MRVFDDQRLVTTRFDGWVSWREVAQGYVAPTLGDDVALLTRQIDDWRPDVVVTGSFAAAARVAAHRRRVPNVSVSIYPQQLAQLPSACGFASSFRASVAQEVEPDGVEVDRAVVTELAWGVSDDCILFHDPALLADARAVGFPYFDRLPARPDDLDRVEAWLGRSDEPTVLVTAGSFLGVRQQELWSVAAGALDALGVRALFVGPRRAQLDVSDGRRADVLAVGFVPLSLVAPRVTAVVHHGGIGTMFATLAAGRPAAVVPQAFDQSYNARLVAGAGVGVDASRSPLEEAVGRLLWDRSLTEGAERLGAALTPTHVAVERVVERVLARAQEGIG
jgi:UDP:flavonoid glycosyltransferase YjiC (YdhE family)